MTHRQPWIDVAKGIGSVLVVYGHVTGGLVNAGLFSGSTILAASTWVIYLFHMPLFFFLSGLNVERGLDRGRWSFVRTRVGNLLLPYLLWSLIQGGLQIASGGAANAHTDGIQLAEIIWRPIGQFWFLYALALCHVTIALLPRRLVLPAAILLFIASLTIVLDDTLLYRACRGFLFYSAGMLLADRIAGWRADPRWLLSWLVFGAVAWVAYPRGVQPASILVLPATIAGIVGTLWISKRLAGLPARVLAYVGLASLAIFVLHTIVGGIVRIVMLRVHVPPIASLYVPAGVGAATLFPILALEVSRHLGIAGYVGLANLPRRKRGSRAVPASVA